MFEALLGILGAAGSGGLIGLLGTAFKGWQEYKERQAQREHDLAMRKLVQEEMRLEHSLRLKQTEVEIAGKQTLAETEASAARDVAASNLQAASYGNDKASYSNGMVRKLKGWWGSFVVSLLVMVDVFRGFMRPGITTYLLVIESLIAWQLFQVVSQLGGMTPEQAWPLFQQVILSVVFLTSTSVTWWFGSRPNSPHRS